MPEVYPLIKKTADYYWSKTNQKSQRDILKEFMTEHAPKFVDAPLNVGSGEMNLEFYSIYNEYLKCYEDNLMEYIDNKLDASVQEFYEELNLIKDDKNIKDKKLLHFVNYLIASTDYASFYKIMIRAAKKLKNPDEGDDNDGEAKAESKPVPVTSNKTRTSNESKSESKNYSPASENKSCK